MKLDEIQLIPLLDTLRLEKISDQEYFSKKYNYYISNSRLNLLNPQQDGSPEKFFEGFKPIGYSPALELGSAVHELVLQSDSFALAPDLGKPTAKMGAMADALFGKEITFENVVEASNKVDYFKGKINQDKFNNIVNTCTPYWKAKEEFLKNNKDYEYIFLDAKSIETVKSCVKSLNENKYVQDLLHPTGFIEDPVSENEKAILLDVKAVAPNGNETILHLKSKLDNYTIDTETGTIVINDVKTIGKILSEIENNIDKFHYNRELGMYMYLLTLCAEKFYNVSKPNCEANYLVVSTIPNYYSKIRAITKKELAEGFKEFQTLLKYTAYLICCKDYEFK